MQDLTRVRNIGISAHIDSGKTTLTERMLYYAGRIHRMQEVKGDGGGATMDHMELEKERGITITSAATTIKWDAHKINIIDTPGHVDFTVEVERSLRVLDGAVLVLCGVGGVQSQSYTVDRQMKRYNVPRIAFINKCDRVGADPGAVISQLETKLNHVAVPMQLPIGMENDFQGVVDLVKMKALYFDGTDGADVRVADIPADLKEPADRARHAMLDTLSLYNDELMELLLEDQEPPEELIQKTVREATCAREITPVFMGSAFKNKGVQPLLDAIALYVPSPLDRIAFARDNENEGAEVALSADPDAQTVTMAFKIVDESFGQLTFARIYQGKIIKGQTYINTRTRKKARIGRILRMHADKREDLDEASAGDIVALIGVDCASGDTLCAAEANYSLENIHVAEPVISLAISPTKNADRDKMSKAIQRFLKEDPTFHVRFDEESSQTVISGMGELHLEIYIERMRREYKCEIEVGAPRVAYREMPTREVAYNYKHKKQTGGSGQFAHIIGTMIPISLEEEDEYLFENSVTGGRIPTEYIPSVDKGFQMARMKGPLTGFEIIKIKMQLDDGSHHAVDSSDLAFQICARNAFREMYLRSKPAILEPIMQVEIESPSEFQGNITGDLASRRGIITCTEIKGPTTIIIAEVPLANMFGYATDIRSATQGKATFSMEFACYRRCPASVQEEIVAEHKKSLAASS